MLMSEYDYGYSPKGQRLIAVKPGNKAKRMSICGALPLVFASGAGANAQVSVGLGIIGGALSSLLLATYLIPAYFILIY